MNDKICVNRSVFSILIIVVFIFFLLAFFKKITNTLVTRNNQAAVRKQQLPACSYIVRSGNGGTHVLANLGISTTSPPSGFRYININGKKMEIYNSGEIQQSGFQVGDVTSLLPTDHAKIPCQGEYLGNVWQQNFDDGIIRLVLNGNYLVMSGFQNPITQDRLDINLKTLCSQQYGQIYYSFQPQTFEQIGCNFITAVKTSRVGGKTACLVYETVRQAYDAFLTDTNPGEFKWYSIAILGKKANCHPNDTTQTGCYNDIADEKPISYDLVQSLLCPSKGGIKENSNSIKN